MFKLECQTFKIEQLYNDGGYYDVCYYLNNQLIQQFQELAKLEIKQLNTFKKRFIKKIKEVIDRKNENLPITQSGISWEIATALIKCKTPPSKTEQIKETKKELQNLKKEMQEMTKGLNKVIKKLGDVFHD